MMALPKHILLLGQVDLLTFEFGAAERELRRAPELNPNLATAHAHYSLYMESLGRLSDAEKELERAQELDPLSLQFMLRSGFLLYLRQQYDQAIAQFQKVLEIDPNYATAHLALSDTDFAKGKYAEAIEEASLYLKASGSPAIAAQVKQNYAKSGYRGALQTRISHETDPGNLELYYPWQVALDYARLGG